MQVERDVVQATTAADGTATVYSKVHTGRLLGIVWIKPGSGGITGAQFVATLEATGEAVLTATSVSSSANYYPRVPTVDTSNAAALFAAAGKAVLDHLYLANDRVVIAITGGGNVLTGTFHFIFG